MRVDRVVDPRVGLRFVGGAGALDRLLIESREGAVGARRAVDVEPEVILFGGGSPTDGVPMRPRGVGRFDVAARSNANVARRSLHRSRDTDATAGGDGQDDKEQDAGGAHVASAASAARGGSMDGGGAPHIGADR